MNLFLASNISFVAKDIAKKCRKISDNRKLLFIPTAAEGEEGDLWWLDLDRKALTDAGFELTEYTLTNQNEAQVRSKLAGYSGVFISGGNTYYLLVQIRKSGFDRVIREYIKNGLIYLGSSAGSLVAGPTIETSLDVKESAPELTDYSGMNLTDVSVRPHWGSDHFRERYMSEMQRLYGIKTKMVMLHDYQYLYVADDSFQIVTVSSES